jgi:hypothetical protein
MQALRSRLARFRDDCRATFSVFFAVSLLPLAFAAAFAVEHTHTLMLRDKVQSIADALVLRSAASPSSSQLSPEYDWNGRLGQAPASNIEQWRQFMSGQFWSALTADKLPLLNGLPGLPQFAYDTTTKTVSLSYAFWTKPLFGKLFTPGLNTSFHQKGFNISTQARLGSEQPIEIALVFDVTSSMDRPGKWTSAVAQAKTFVTDMMKSPATTMAIVPFGDRVPVDRLNSWSPPYNTNSWPKIDRSYNWYGQVRNGEKQDIKSLQWPIQGGDVSWMAKSALETTFPGIKILDGNEDTFCPELPGAIATLDDTPPASFVAWLQRYDTQSSWVSSRTGGYRVPLPCPDRRFVMQPLTDSEADLQAKIDMLVPWDQGTRIDHGLLWGWYNLSPKWRGRFDAKLHPQGWWPGGSADNFMFNASQAAQRPTATARKALVMFTDGENWPSPDYYRCKLKSVSNPNVFCENEMDRPPDTPSYVPTKSELDGETLALCSKIKAAGIEIFYVQYQVTSSVLNGCATDSAHLFNAADGNQLSETFAKIRDKIRSGVHLYR